MLGKTVAIILHGSHLEREGLTSILQLRERFAGTLEAATLEEALALTCVSAALVLVDLALPSLKGGAGLSLLRRQFPAARVIGVSHDQEVQPEIGAIADHADGVICNRLSEDEMRAAVDLVLGGTTFKPPCAGGTGCIPCLSGVGCIEHGSSPLPKTELQRLTARQGEVFALFRRGFTDRQMAIALGLSEATVRYHLNAACKSLGLSNRVAAMSLQSRGSPGDD